MQILPIQKVLLTTVHVHVHRCTCVCVCVCVCVSMFALSLAINLAPDSTKIRPRLSFMTFIICDFLMLCLPVVQLATVH